MKHYWISMFFFFLAMSMKISAGISVVALFCIYVMNVFSIIKFKENEKLFPKKLWQLLPFIIIFIIIGSWVYYAKLYNSRNGCGYFSTTIYPIWETKYSSIATIIEYIKNLWLNQYFHKYTLWFFLSAFLVNIFLMKKNKTLLISLNLLELIGSILYSILWFITFQQHDYYTINLYILLVFTVLTFSEAMNRLFPKICSNIFIKTILIVFLVFNVYHTSIQIKHRYTGWWTEYPKFKDFHTITPYLRSIGITRNDTVISIPDQSHHTLYLMNQPGWTECFGLNKDSNSIAKSIERGAKYLIVASKDWHPEKTVHFEKWPRHCVQGTKGAELHPDLKKEKISQIVLKGALDQEEGYSVFEGIDIDLEKFLKDNEVNELYITGLVTEYCVKETAIDAAKRGFTTFVIKEAVEGVELNAGDVEKAFKEMEKAGVRVISSSDING
ncbi:TPA: isochorismatase family protein [bacterium]|nr:isochorismatase family protein [bacterium]